MLAGFQVIFARIHPLVIKTVLTIFTKQNVPGDIEICRELFDAFFGRKPGDGQTLV